MKGLIYFLIGFFLFMCSCEECKEERIYYPNGKLKCESCQMEGRFTGLVKCFYENGNAKSKVEFIDNLRNGLAVFYHENGALRDSLIFKEDIPNGFAYRFDNDGRLKRKGYNVNDKFYGEVFTYYKDNGYGIDIIKQDTIYAYKIYNEDKHLTEEWIRKIKSEPFNVFIEKDTVLRDHEFKAKITVNHFIADSIRVYVYDPNLKRDRLKFRWPEENTVKYIYSTTPQNSKTNTFSGQVILYYRSDLTNPKYAGKKETRPFSVSYCVQK